MTKTLAQLWAGSLAPIRSTGRNNPELTHVGDLWKKNWNVLTALLTDNQQARDQAQKVADALEEYLLLVREQSFCEGFCLGSKILVEALTGADETI